MFFLQKKVAQLYYIARDAMNTLIQIITLQNATFNQLNVYQFICQGTGIEWTELDYHLSIESMLLSQSKQQAA